MTRPPFTAFPHTIIDMMPDMTPNEWKLFCYVYRMTVGYQGRAHKLTYDHLMKGTGIASRATLKKAIDGVCKFGLCRSGSVWTYNGNSTETVLSENENSTETVLPIVQKLYSNSTETVLNIGVLKKVLKKEEKKEEEATTPHQKLMNKFTELTTRLPPNSKAGESYRLSWVEPIDAMLLLCGNRVDDAIGVLERCVEIARGDNWNGKAFRVASPKSLLKTFKFEVEGERLKQIAPATAGWKVAFDLAVATAGNGGTFASLPDDVKRASKGMWNEIKLMDDYSRKRVANKFREVYSE